MTSIQTYEEKIINLINRYINDGIDERKLFTMLHNLYYEIEEMHKQEIKQVSEFWHRQPISKPIFNEYYQETFKKD